MEAHEKTRNTSLLLFSHQSVKNTQNVGHSCLPCYLRVQSTFLGNTLQRHCTIEVSQVRDLPSPFPKLYYNTCYPPVTYGETHSCDIDMFFNALPSKTLHIENNYTKHERRLDLYFYIKNSASVGVTALSCYRCDTNTDSECAEPYGNLERHEFTCPADSEDRCFVSYSFLPLLLCKYVLKGFQSGGVHFQLSMN